MADYNNENFYTSKEYSLEELKNFLENKNTEKKIRDSFSKNHFLSSKDFSFITWDTFSKLGFIDKASRSDEDVKHVEERLDYLNKYIYDCLKVSVDFIILYYNKTFFLFDKAKYSVDKITKIIDQKQ